MKTRKAITMIISVLFLLKCAVLTMVFFITGCAIKSSQLKEINNRVNEKDTELRPFAWRLMWNQYEKVVYSVDLNPVYLFGNINGDAITIDNFNLQEAQGLGRFNYLWQFIEKDGSLRAYESGQLRETYQCSEWSLQETFLKDNCMNLSLSSWFSYYGRVT